MIDVPSRLKHIPGLLWPSDVFVVAASVRQWNSLFDAPVAELLRVGGPHTAYLITWDDALTRIDDEKKGRLFFLAAAHEPNFSTSKRRLLGEIVDHFRSLAVLAREAEHKALTLKDSDPLFSTDDREDGDGRFWT